MFRAHYSGPWDLRALLLALLRGRGVKALVGTRSFNQAVPDQCDWVERLCSHADRNSRTSLQDFLDYTGLSAEPPEYCSMHLCIWGTNLLPEDTVQQFSQDPAKAHEQVLQYKIQNGMWPHPVTFLETVAAGQKPASSCSAVQAPETTAAPTVSGSFKHPGAAGPRAPHCIKRDGAARK